MAMQAKKIRRRQYFIAPEFQIRYIRFILFVMFGVGALAAYTVYYKSMILLGGKLANVYPQGRLVAIVKSVNIQIMLSLLLITPLVVIIGLFLSHRMAGPVYRMEKTLTAMGNGDISARITLRKRDEFKSLADRINFVVDSMRSKVVAESGVVNRLRDKIVSLEGLSKGERIESDTLKRELALLKKDVEAMDKSLSSYKI